ncbi:MAG: CHAT domain-containing protein [Smithellaceae bacterium]
MIKDNTVTYTLLFPAMRRNSTIILILGIILTIFPAVFSGASNIPTADQARSQLTMGNSKKAWEIVSAEIANPTESSQKNLCDLHGANLRILTVIVNHDFAPADPDLVARKSYDYVMQNCGQFIIEKGVAESNYGYYFSNTHRPGLAILHFKKAMRYLSEQSLHIVENNISSVYGDMGQFELRDYHRSRAIKLAKEYFRTPRSYKAGTLDEASSYMAYKSILERRLGDISWSDNITTALPEMRELWQEITTLNNKWISRQTRYIAYTNASQWFASAGDTRFARELLNEAKQLVDKYSQNNLELAKLDLEVAEAKILSKEGNYLEAAALYNDWNNSFSRVTGRSTTSNNLRLVGLANELAGNYTAAIENLEKVINDIEKIRSSFQVESRGQIISGLAVTVHWGLLRAYAARYLKHGNAQDLQAALRTENKLRARQFGELRGIDNKVNISGLKLRPDELLLDYVLTDTSIVIFAISANKTDLIMIPFDAKVFNATVGRVKMKLSQPGKPDELTDDLLSISKLVLMPVVQQLGKKKKITVISDGYLSGIPFSLLSKSPSFYYPLIKEHEVVLTPSISYLMTEKNNKEEAKYDKALFALADPQFGTIATPEAYRDDTEVFYTRAVKDMNVFTPLPETRTEVTKISELLRPGASKILVGDKATKANVKAQPLIGYRYLHFATHGILGNQVPGVFEPALVLSTDSGYSGDAFLTLSEIEKMKLNSDLTVLSACDTGSGKYYTGEGIMGLSRGFLLAGSRSVLASLWPIDSQATVRFMLSFYKHLQAGKSKSESLRLTQLAFIEAANKEGSSVRGLKVTGKNTPIAKLSHPYYWAPFVLTGE